ncbi:MAG: alpha/beta fold hydrolase [Burkholderiales bacterium]|nr:alpha/beta fold hydrolase [Burkholderiales bacterium]
MRRAVQFAAADGFRLAATLHLPETPNGRAVLVHGATGVRRRYYGRFADELAGRGFTVLTFDYRGIGESRRGPLRALAARMRDWAELDAGAALGFLARAAPGAALFCVGHSFGANALGLVPGIERYRAAAFVGAPSGYWRHWAGSARAAMWLLTHALLPGVAAALGYFPMRALGQGEDLPGGVAREWARWCRHPRYAAGVAGGDGYARLAAPIRSYCASDDRYAPRAAAEALLELYPNAASKKLVVLDAAACGGIGHFGYFRERLRETLWAEIADWFGAM